MKKIIKIYKNYIFINYTTYNYNGFIEHSELYKNSYLMEKKGIQYYNRSWQVYEYQCSMLKVINTLIENLKEDLKKEYKDTNNIKKLTKDKQKDLEKFYKTSATLKEYIKIKDLLNKNRY